MVLKKMFVMYLTSQHQLLWEEMNYAPVGVVRNIKNVVGFTLVEASSYDGEYVKIFFPKTIEELSVIPIGLRAESVRLDIEFSREDIPHLIKFLQNVEPSLTFSSNK